MHCHLRPCRKSFSAVISNHAAGSTSPYNITPAYTEFQHNRIIRGWFIDGSANFPSQIFKEAIFGALFSELGDQTTHNLGWHGYVIGVSSHFKHIASFLNQSDLSATRVENREQIAFSSPMQKGRDGLNV